MNWATVAFAAAGGLVGMLATFTWLWFKDEERRSW